MPSVSHGHLQAQVFLGFPAIPYQFHCDPMIFYGFKCSFVCLNPLACPGERVALCNSGDQISMLASHVETVVSESSLVLASRLTYDTMLASRFQECGGTGWHPALFGPRILYVEPQHAWVVCKY